MHRYPVILPEPEDWEVEMFDLQDKIAKKHKAVC
jgi:hypothetical protein